MYKIKVDSCKLSIPLSKCEILNQDLLDKFTDYRVNESSGEMETINFHTNGIPFILNNHEDGTYIKIWCEPQINYDKKTKSRTSEMYLSLLVNSKHLQTRYFDGITLETLPILHKYIMAKNVFKCDLRDFKQSRYADIDICFDFVCNAFNFQTLKDNIIAKSLNKMHFHTTNTLTNSGIWTPTRKKPREQATPKKPYIKFYSKEIDFQTKSKIFADTYLKDVNYKDFVRYECTIKNSEHKKRLKINEFPTFETFLDSDLQLISTQIFNEYFEKVKLTAKKTKLTAMDKALIDIINLAIENGATKSEIHKAFNRYDVDAKSRGRLLAKYQSLYSRDEINKKQLEANDVSESIFKFLGVDLSQTELEF